MTETVKTSSAKIIRVLTIPPLLVLLLLTALFFIRSDIYSGIPQLIISICLLMLVPILSYPIAAVIPSLKAKGRDGQRNAGFVTSIIGYTAVFIYGLLANVSMDLMLIYTTYFLSVIVLALINKVFKHRASGHACSIVGPLILTVYFAGWIYLLPCTIILALVIWSSLYLKRHTKTELFWGGFSSTLSFIISLIAVNFGTICSLLK